MVKRTLLGIVIFFLLCFPLVNKSASESIMIHIKKGNLYKEAFTEPFESVLTFFVNGDIVIMTAKDPYCIPVTPTLFIKYINDNGDSIKGAMLIIHNHLAPYPFSKPDINFYHGVKRRGFHGLFLLYYPFNNRVVPYIEEEGNDK